MIIFSERSERKSRVRARVVTDKTEGGPSSRAMPLKKNTAIPCVFHVLLFLHRELDKRNSHSHDAEQAIISVTLTIV